MKKAHTTRMDPRRFISEESRRNLDVFEVCKEAAIPHLKWIPHRQQLLDLAVEKLVNLEQGQSRIEAQISSMLEMFEKCSKDPKVPLSHENKKPSKDPNVRPANVPLSHENNKPVQKAQFEETLPEAQETNLKDEVPLPASAGRSDAVKPPVPTDEVMVPETAAPQMQQEQQINLNGVLRGAGDAGDALARLSPEAQSDAAPTVDPPGSVDVPVDQEEAALPGARAAEDEQSLEPEEDRTTFQEIHSKLRRSATTQSLASTTTFFGDQDFGALEWMPLPDKVVKPWSLRQKIVGRTRFYWRGVTNNKRLRSRYMILRAQLKLLSQSAAAFTEDNLEEQKDARAQKLLSQSADDDRNVENDQAVWTLNKLQEIIADFSTDLRMAGCPMDQFIAHYMYYCEKVENHRGVNTEREALTALISKGVAEFEILVDYLKVKIDMNDLLLYNIVLMTTNLLTCLGQYVYNDYINPERTYRCKH